MGIQTARKRTGPLTSSPLSIRNVLHIAYVKSDASDTSYVRQSTTFLLASNAQAAERLAAMEERLAELGATPEA